MLVIQLALCDAGGIWDRSQLAEPNLRQIQILYLLYITAKCRAFHPEQAILELNIHSV